MLATRAAMPRFVLSVTADAYTVAEVFGADGLVF
jgi:hypothetical protein